MKKTWSWAMNCTRASVSAVPQPWTATGLVVAIHFL